MSAHALTEIPDAHGASTVATNELSLIRMNDDVVYRGLVYVVALKTACTRVPDLDSSVLGTGHHPLALTMEGYPGDIVGVTLEGHHRVGVGALDIVELHIGVPGCREESLVRRDTQAIDLRIRVLDRTRANPRKGLPEAVFDASVNTVHRWKACFRITYRMV